MSDNLNHARPMMMHIDLNSCFATIEQQSRPLLRGRPVAIVNRRTEHTSVVTASYEAKALGIGVGTRLADARLLCPDLVALESDPPKYRYVYRKLMRILQDYSPSARMKSIDEGVIDFSKSPPESRERELLDVGREIKQRLRDEIGDYMRCNVGIGPNRFLAKTAAGINKPDGLTEIRADNLRQIYGRLKLEDLTGIAAGYGRRLEQAGILTPLNFLDADEATLVRLVFRSKCGRDWYLRMRGWEVDDREFGLKSVGRQFVMDERDLSYEEVMRRFHGLCEDVAAKLRSQQVMARAIRIYVKNREVGYWKTTIRSQRPFSDEATIYRLARQASQRAPLPALEIGVSCYGLIEAIDVQTDLFGEIEHVDKITTMIDKVNNTWGSQTLHSANTLGLGGRMSRKIPFGSVRYL